MFLLLLEIIRKIMSMLDSANYFMLVSQIRAGLDSDVATYQNTLVYFQSSKFEQQFLLLKMHFHFKSSTLLTEFLGQFQEDKRQQVAEALLMLGVDIAKKLGQKNPRELYATLKQLARNIENDYNQSHTSELREDIKKIQYQLSQLNNYFDHKQRFYTQNDFEDQNYRSPVAKNPKESVRTSKRSNRTKSPNYTSSNPVTAKITESPPPPILYIQNVNTKFNVKPHLDDHQIKQLLYSENDPQPYDSLSARPLRHQSPPTIRYTLNLDEKDPQSIHQNFHQNAHQNHHLQQPQLQTRKKTRQSLSRSKRKILPSYLQNVESKIKDQLDQDKIAYRQRQYQNPYAEQEKAFQVQEHTAEFQKGKKQLNQNQSSTETYYEIQQYLMNQNAQKFDYSPVQEMKDASNKQNFQDPASKSRHSSDQFARKPQRYYEQQQQQVSDFHMTRPLPEQSFDAFRKRAQLTSPYTVSLQQSSNMMQTNQKQEDESSDSFSNFTPPNQEVREFFQKQFTYQ